MKRSPSPTAKGRKATPEAGGAWRWLALRIFLVALVAVALAVGGGAFVVWSQGEQVAVRRAVEALAAGHSARTSLEERRLETLRLRARLLAQDSELAASLPTGAGEELDPEALALWLDGRRQELGLDLALVVDPTGGLLAVTGRSVQGLGEAALQSIARRISAAPGSHGMELVGSRLVHILSRPLSRGEEPWGQLAVGVALDEVLALELRRMSGAQVVFLAATPRGPEVTASTLATEAATGVVMGLRLRADALVEVLERGGTVDRLELLLEGEPWLALLAPIKAADGTPVGATVHLASLAREVGPFRDLAILLLAGGLLALLLAFLLSAFLSFGVTTPLGRLGEALEGAAEGRYDRQMVKATGPAARAVRAFRRLAQDLQGKGQMEEWMLRALPGPLSGTPQGPAESPEILDLSLVAVEARRYARAEAALDPRETADRFARDLRKTRDVVRSLGGRIESLLGQRILASFDGEDHPFRAVTAAARLVVDLGQPESAFEEAEPPAVAVTTGRSVASPVAAGSAAPGHTLLGLAVQQLEALLREATPGDLILSRVVYRQINERLEAAGWDLAPQRGVLSPQPLYVLSTAAAAGLAQAWGGETAAAAALPAAAPGLDPGTVVADRFEIRESLGSGRLGPVYAARDLESDRWIALRILSPPPPEGSGDEEQLVADLRTVREASHPHLVPLYEYRRVPEGFLVATALVRGMALPELLRNGRWPVLAGLRLGRQLASALGALHRQDLAHGLVHPGNVLLSWNGEAHLADAGLRSLLPLPERIGAWNRVLPYLAPEQWYHREVTPRTDVYSWGVLFFRLLTGEFPGPAATPSRESSSPHGKATAKGVELPELPPALKPILARCLGEDPATRYPTAQELLQALAEVELEG